MITELSIQNFAIIDDISITFHDGLTVLTGETGAGKSIIIDAVQLLTGGRGSVEFVRHGAQKADIVGLFSLDVYNEPINHLCDIHDVTLEDDMLILERTITKRGKSICRVNGKIVTLTVLRKFGQSVVNIHSQHDTVQLMDRRTHLPLLDLYNTHISTYMEQYKALYEHYRSLQVKYEQLNDNEQETAHRLDLLQFQLNELREANIQENEMEILTDERNKLQNFERIYQSVNTAYTALYGEQKGLEWVDVAQSTLQEAKEVSPFVANKADELTSVYYQLEEIHFALRDFTESLHFDEARLNEIEARLDELTRLSKKYGSTIAEMIAYQEKITLEIDEIEHKDTHLTELEDEMAKVKLDTFNVGKELHNIRQETARQLEADISTELADLYLENATFSVHFEPIVADTLYPDGLDKMTFRLSTNLGEPLKDLHKVASGGELSRVMLALKKVFAKHDHINTVIFDEIDTGVSGRVAQAIAEKMYQISLSTQVLCITHLPQVAAMADQHVLIEKIETQNRTTTNMKELTDKAKVNELGKMITGTKLTDTAIEHSEELLELTRTFKQSI